MTAKTKPSRLQLKPDLYKQINNCLLLLYSKPSSFLYPQKMQQQSLDNKQPNKQQTSLQSPTKPQQLSRNLFALIGQSSYNLMPYRSKFQLNSIGSGKSHESRDSDLLNRLAKQSSKASSKSLSRNVSFHYVAGDKHKSQLNSSKSNSIVSDSEKSLGKEIKPSKESSCQLQASSKVIIETQKMVPKIHNCVCMVAGQCLGYNCNCFLSPYPCAPDCCPNCLTLKSSLPLKLTNVCSCKKTRCLKLYCECLAKGLYCNPFCQCNLCENHEHSVSRIESIHNYQMYRGCSCQKSHCKKKYCDCFAQGLKCTSKCVCMECHNFLQLREDKGVEMEVQGNIGEEKMEVQGEGEGEKQQQEEEVQFQEIDFFGHQNKRKK